MQVIVTGASKGIGYELTKKFIEKEGNTVYAIARDKQRLKHLKQDCDKYNSDSVLLPIPYDLTDDSFEILEKQIINNGSKIDILINNAGYLISKPFTEFNEKEAHDILEVNFFAPAKLIRNLIPFLQQSNQGHIVNISSMGGFQGSQKFPGLSYYSASKAAIASLTECLALELKEYNISVNCLALGAVQTEMLAEAFPDYKAPLKANEMAEYIIDFAINGQNYFNGKILPVSLSTP